MRGTVSSHRTRRRAEELASVVVVTGAAGVGKTALTDGRVGQFGSIMDGRRMLVAWTTCPGVY
jgi:adenylate kinase